MQGQRSRPPRHSPSWQGHALLSLLPLSQNRLCFTQRIPGSWGGGPGDPDSRRDPCHLLRQRSWQSCVYYWSSQAQGWGREGRKWVWGKALLVQWPAPLPTHPVSEATHGFQNSVQGAARGSAEQRLLPSPSCPCSEVPRPYSQSPGFVSLLVGTCWCDSARLPLLPAVCEQRGTRRKWELNRPS